MSWIKSETLSNVPDSLGRKNAIETWTLKDRDGVAVAAVSKGSDDAVSLTVGGNAVTATQLSNLVTYGNPTGVKVYRALLTQTGTNAPEATPLENTLGGDVVWARSAPGTYTGTLAGAFPANKTLITSTVVSGDGEIITCLAINADVIRVESVADDFLDGHWGVSVLVYP